MLVRIGKMRGFIDFNGDNTVDLIADNTSTGEKATWQSVLVIRYHQLSLPQN